MRKAFSMLTAIFVIVLMATVAVFIMNLSGKMVKGTTAQFLREQSVLLAKSYTEYAIMAVTANEHNTSNCLNNITGSYSIYDINVNISYIGNSDLDGSCNLASATSNTVTTAKSPLNIIVDVFVSYDELDHPSSPKVTYHRRSLQKI
jgi:hypothetical protein